RYGRPTFLIGWDGDTGRGSGRSIAGFDLHGALRRVGHHLEKYGGHTMAAGRSVGRARFEAFRAALLRVAGGLLDPRAVVPRPGSRSRSTWRSVSSGTSGRVARRCKPGWRPWRRADEPGVRGRRGL